MRNVGLQDDFDGLEAGGLQISIEDIVNAARFEIQESQKVIDLTSIPFLYLMRKTISNLIAGEELLEDFMTAIKEKGQGWQARLFCRIYETK